MTAALWYKSASGRGDAPESNTVSSSEQTTRKEREREREVGVKRGWKEDEAHEKANGLCNLPLRV